MNALTISEKTRAENNRSLIVMSLAYNKMLHFAAYCYALSEA